MIFLQFWSSSYEYFLEDGFVGCSVAATMKTSLKKEVTSYTLLRPSTGRLHKLIHWLVDAVFTFDVLCELELSPIDTSATMPRFDFWTSWLWDLQ